MGDSSHRGPTLQDQPNASLRDVSETATATVKMEVRLVCLRMFGFIRGKSTTNKPRSRKVLEVRKRAGSLDVLAGNCHQLFTLHFMHPPLPSPKRQSLRDRCKKKKKKVGEQITCERGGASHQGRRVLLELLQML